MILKHISVVFMLVSFCMVEKKNKQEKAKNIIFKTILILYFKILYPYYYIIHISQRIFNFLFTFCYNFQFFKPLFV